MAWRLFIAIRIPEAVKTEFERVQRQLGDGMADGVVRWTRREQLHLTLKFLGNVQPERVEELLQAVRTASRSFGPFEMRAARVGSFPNWRRPRVVWAGIEADRLVALQQAIETASLQFTGEEPEERFRAHVTLGRVKEIRPRQATLLAERAAALAERSFGAWTTGEVEVLRSEFSRTGATHTVIGLAPLGG